ncbi:MAG TPA: signal peptidase I [Luteibaculaceae bacterium]|nr:signal peptidase I [Luteibaculaceae bacterium]
MISYFIFATVILAQCYALPKLLSNAGIQVGWKGYVPVLNWFYWTKLIQCPWWWSLLLLIPGVNLVMLGVFHVQTASSFNKRQWVDYFSAVFIPMVFLPKLALENPTYVGPIDWKEEQNKGRKKPIFTEWGHAIVFAVVAASIIRNFFFEAYTIPTPSMEKRLLVGDYLFVSKLSYGPRLPETPVAMPFFHHTMPLTTSTPAFLNILKLPYLRLPGFGEVERFDPVVFNFPDGDTVLIENQAQGLNQCVRDEAYMKYGPNFTEANFAAAKQEVLATKEFVIRPTDKKENYIKSCVGLPGETLEVKNGKVYIDGKFFDKPKNAQESYDVIFAGSPDPKMLKLKYNIGIADMQRGEQPDVINIAMDDATANQLKANGVVSSIQKAETSKGAWLSRPLNIFPNQRSFDWSEDNFGPVFIPKKGSVLPLQLSTLPIYEKLIRDYEHNQLRVEGNTIFINNQPATSYTCKQNYYWMMGDNRHRSADSRFWGFVPEDHIVGKAVFIWFSKDPETGIRWNRIFSLVR